MYIHGGSVKCGARTAAFGVVSWTVLQSNSEATASSWEPKNIYDMHVRLFFCLCHVLCNVPMLTGL